MSSSRCSTPTRRSARGSVIQESRRYERGDYEQGLAQADAVVEAEYTTQTLNHNPLETHQCVCEWRGDGLDVYVSTQYIWGIRRDLAEALGLPEDKVRVICEFMGGGFGAKTSVGNYILLAAELAKRTGRPVQLRTLPARGERRRRQPQRHAPARDRGGAGRRDADRARRRVHLRARLVGLAAADGRADAAALRLRERPDGRARRQAEHPADGRLPRARASSRGRGRSSASWTSWRRSSASTRSSCAS